MIVKLLTEHHLEFLSLKGGCSGSSESTHVKMPHCWKSHVTAHIPSSSTIGLNDNEALYCCVLMGLKTLASDWSTISALQHIKFR